MTAGEEWRPVPGYEGYYEVSSEGRVRSFRRHGATGGLKRLTLGSNGYLVVSLSKHNVKKIHRVHRLVAFAFLGPAPSTVQVRHLDGNPSRSVLANLAYGSAGDNLLDRVAHGRHHNARKTHCIHGHEFTPENTYSPPSHPTSRYCRTCAKSRGEARRQRNKQAIPQVESLLNDAHRLRAGEVA